MINGKRYSWEDITVQMPHGTLVDIDSIEYSDEKEIEAVYGKGSNPLGYGTGNYSASGKATLLREEHNKFVSYAKQQSSNLYRLPPFPITVSYANEDQPSVTDVLKQCKINKVSRSGSQGDKSNKVEYEFIILGGIEDNRLAPN